MSNNEDVKKTETKLNKNAAEKIWEEIKDKNIEMFSLPPQKINAQCSPVNIEPNKLYLKYKASSTIAALETALGEKYKVELAGQFITVAKSQ